MRLTELITPQHMHAAILELGKETPQERKARVDRVAPLVELFARALENDTQIVAMLMAFSFIDIAVEVATKGDN